MPAWPRRSHAAARIITRCDVAPAIATTPATGHPVTDASTHPDLQALRAELEALAPDQGATIARFFDGAAPAIGITALDLTETTQAAGERNLAVIAADDDPNLRDAFTLRDRVDDVAFNAAWSITDPPRFGCLGHPHRPLALIRYHFTASLQIPRHGSTTSTRRSVNPAFVLDPTQIGPELLRRFYEPGMGVWMIPASVAAREQHRAGPGCAYDTLSRCLPVGVVTSGQPVRAIELALAHTGQS